MRKLLVFLLVVSVLLGADFFPLIADEPFFDPILGRLRIRKTSEGAWTTTSDNIYSELGVIGINDHLRFAPGPDDSIIAQKLENGIWIPASISVSPSTIRVGNTVRLAAIGEHLMGKPAEADEHHIYVYSDFDGELSTSGPKTLYLDTRVIRNIIQADDTGTFTGLEHGFTYVNPVHTFISKLYLQTGSTAATQPVRFQIFLGTDDTGPIIFDQTYPTSIFALTDTEIELELDGWFEIEYGIDYYFKWSSTETFSFKTTAAVTLPWFAADQSFGTIDNILSTTGWVEGSVRTTGDWYIDHSSRKIYVAKTTGTKAASFDTEKDTEWDELGTHITQDSEIMGDLYVHGDLTVDGAIISQTEEHLIVTDSHILLNSGYRSTTAKSGGLTVNYFPTATADTVTAGSFTAGVAATSNPTVTTDTATVFSANDIVMVSGSVENDGVYEVVSHSSNILTVRGVGTVSTIETFTNNQFIANPSDNAYLTKINVSVLEADLTGQWRQGTGSQTPITYTTIGEEYWTESAGFLVPITSTDGLKIDNDVLYVDPVTDRVGINTLFPSTDLDVNGSVNVFGQVTAVTFNGNLLGNVTGNLNGDVSGFFDGSISSDTTATTQAAGDNSGKLATTEYVDSSVVLEDHWNRIDNTLVPANAGDDVEISGSFKTLAAYRFADGSTQEYGATPDDFKWHTDTARFKRDYQFTHPVVNFTMQPNGDMLFITGRTQDVWAYTLSNPWDISSLALANTLDVSANILQASGIVFNDVGDLMFITDRNNYNIHTYSLTTPWDISSAQWLQDTDFSEIATYIRGIRLSPTGENLYVTDRGIDEIHHYSLSIPWDLSTKSPTPANLNHSSEETSARDVFFKPDGRRVFIIGISSDTVHSYYLDTPWYFDSYNYTPERSFSTLEYDTNPGGIYINPDASKFYLVGADTDKIYEFDLGLAVEGSFRGQVHVWENSNYTDDRSGMLVEQEGSGNTGIHFKVLGGQEYSIGIDNADEDKYKIAIDNTFADPAIEIDSSGNVHMPHDFEITGIANFYSTIYATNLYQSIYGSENNLILDVPFNQAVSLIQYDRSSLGGQVVLSDLVVSPNQGMFGEPVAVFTGTEYAELPSGRFDDFTNGLTFEIWVYPTSLNVWDKFFSLSTGTTSESINFGRESNTNNLTFNIRVGGISEEVVTTGGELVLNEWQLLTATLTSAGIGTIYKNGVELATGSLHLPANVSRTVNIIAKNSYSDEGYFFGRLARAKVYNGALLPEEVRTHYLRQGGQSLVTSNDFKVINKAGQVSASIDSSGNTTLSGDLVINGDVHITGGTAYQDIYSSEDGLILDVPLNLVGIDTQYDTSSNGVEIIPSGIGVLISDSNGPDGGHCAIFDGSDYYQLPSGYSNFTNGLSIEMWVYPTAVTQYERFIEIGNDTVDHIRLLRNGTTQNLRYRVSQGAVGEILDVYSNPIEQDAWQHFIITHDSLGTATIYKNGVNIGSGPVHLPLDVLRSQNNLGADGLGDNRFTGRMAGVKLYDRALTEDEVKTAYLRQGGDSLVVSNDFKIIDTSGDIKFKVTNEGVNTLNIAADQGINAPLFGSGFTSNLIKGSNTDMDDWTFGSNVSKTSVGQVAMDGRNIATRVEWDGLGAGIIILQDEHLANEQIENSTTYSIEIDIRWISGDSDIYLKFNGTGAGEVHHPINTDGQYHRELIPVVSGSSGNTFLQLRNDGANAMVLEFSRWQLHEHSTAKSYIETRGYHDDQAQDFQGAWVNNDLWVAGKSYFSDTMDIKGDLILEKGLMSSFLGSGVTDNLIEYSNDGMSKWELDPNVEITSTSATAMDGRNNAARVAWSDTGQIRLSHSYFATMPLNPGELCTLAFDIKWIAGANSLEASIRNDTFTTITFDNDGEWHRYYFLLEYQQDNTYLTLDHLTSTPLILEFARWQIHRGTDPYPYVETDFTNTHSISNGLFYGGWINNDLLVANNVVAGGIIWGKEYLRVDTEQDSISTFFYPNIRLINESEQDKTGVSILASAEPNGGFDTAGIAFKYLTDSASDLHGEIIFGIQDTDQFINEAVRIGHMGTLSNAYFGGIGEYENLVDYSEDFSSWDSNDMDVNSTASLAPDKTNTATELSATIVFPDPPESLVSNDLNVVDGVQYNVSFWAKWVGSESDMDVTLGASAPITIRVQDEKWQRYDIAITCGSGSPNLVFTRLSSATFQLWGVQITQSYHKQGYVATNGHAHEKSGGGWINGVLHATELDVLTLGDTTANSLYQNVYESEDNLLFHVPFNIAGADTQFDTSVYARQISPSGAGVSVVEGAGLFGNAAVFDGTAHYSLDANILTDFSNGYSLELWAYPTSANADARLIEFGADSFRDIIAIQRFGTSEDLIFIVWDEDIVSSNLRASNVFTLNQWHHIVVTHDSSGLASLYVDGRLYDSGNLFLPNVVTRNYNFIGAGAETDTEFIGAISNFKVYGRVLSAQEARTQYLRTGGDTVVMSDSFRVVNRLGQNHFTVGDYGEVYCTSLSASADIEADKIFAASELYQPVYGSEDHLVMHMPFNQINTTGQYGTGKYAHVAISNGTNIDIVSGAGPYGNNCASFGGTDGYYQLQDGDGLSDFSNGFTMEVWVYPTAIGDTFSKFIALNTGSTAQNNAIVMSRNATTNELYVNVWDGEVALWNVTSGDEIELNKWQHFIATLDSSGTCTLYKNGAVIGGQSGLAMPPIAARDVNRFGRSPWGAGEFVGYMAEAKIYNRGLSEPEARSHYLRHGGDSLVNANDYRIIDADGKWMYAVQRSSGSASWYNSTGSQTAWIELETGNIHGSDIYGTFFQAYAPNADAQPLLIFNTYRDWMFETSGTGSATALKLRNTVGVNKHFRIQTDGETQFQNQTPTTTAYIDNVTGDVISATGDVISATGGVRGHAEYNLSERTGFQNLTDSFVGVDQSLREFIVGPTIPDGCFTVYNRNVPTCYYEDKSVIWPDTEGKHYFYFTAGGTLETTMTFDARLILGPWAIAGIVIWDAVNDQTVPENDCYDERHGATMDGQTHLFLHQNVGLTIVGNTGLALGGFALDGDGSLDTHAQFGHTAATIADEDLQLPVSAKASTIGNTVMWLEGADTSPVNRSEYNFGFSILTTGSGRAAYNELDAGVFSLIEVPDGDFFLVHVWAITTNTDINRVFASPGIYTYGNANNARDAAYTEIKTVEPYLGIYNELKAIGTVICQSDDSFTNAVKTKIVSTDTGDAYIDWRSGVALGGVPPASLDHNGLSGRDAPDAHPITSISTAAYGVAYSDGGGSLLISSNVLAKADLRMSAAGPSNSITPGLAIPLCGNSTLGAGNMRLKDFSRAVDGSFTYTGTNEIPVLVTAHISMTASANDPVVTLYVAENGNPIANSYQILNFETSGKTEFVTMEYVIDMETSDFVQIYVDSNIPTTITPVSMYIRVKQQL